MTLRTFANGGGVQSTAALVLAAQGKIDFPVHLFSNVGDDSEHPKTLAYVEQVAKPYAATHGIQLIELRRTRRDGTTETLMGRLTKEGSRSLPIPVRMPDTGTPGTRSCTSDFKIRVINRWLKQHGATPDEPASVGIGISLDEIHRANNRRPVPGQVVEYPLLDLGLRRSDCMQVIRDAGLPVPPKSSCYFCPFHRPSEWRRMQHEEPDLFDKAADLEALLIRRRRELDRDPVYLTRFGLPLREVFQHEQTVLFEGSGEGADLDTCETGYCMT